MGESDSRFELNWVQTLAGALAAVTSAVLLSTVGVAGTLIGAALGSLAATVGSAVYSYSIRATHDRVASGGTAGGGFTTVLAGLPWKRIALVATGLFVTAVLVIVTFELVTGRALSSYTGGSDNDRGTSIPGLGGGGSHDHPAGDQDDPQPTPAEPPSSEPTELTGESEQPTPTATPTEQTEETAVPPLTESPEPTPTSAYVAPSTTRSPTPLATETPPPSP